MTTNYLFTVNDPDWLPEVTAWLAAALDADLADLSLTPARVMPWAAVYRVDTPDGSYFFKACGETQAHEPPLVRYLSGRVPGRVVPAAAVDEPRRWLLLPDGGRTIAESALPSKADHVRWAVVLGAAASLQRATEADIEHLLALGVPDARFPALSAISDDLLRDPARLWVGEEGGLSAEQYDDLRSLPERLEPVFGRAAALGVPEAVVHEEAHHGHVFVDETRPGSARYRFFDWGDACIGHPFMWAMMPLRDLRDKYPNAPARLRATRDAYLGHWRDIAAAADLLPALDAAMIGCAVARARTWVLVMDAYGREAFPELLCKYYPQAVAYWLLRADGWLRQHEAGTALL